MYEAVQMLESGWTVKYLKAADSIEWRSPDRVSGSEYRSLSLDHPPRAAIIQAIKQGHIVRSKMISD